MRTIPFSPGLKYAHLHCGRTRMKNQQAFRDSTRNEPLSHSVNELTVGRARRDNLRVMPRNAKPANQPQRAENSIG